MPTATAIVGSVEFWKIAVPAAFAVVAWLFNERAKREWERWQLKKAACLRALNIANVVLSNAEYHNVKKEYITPQHETIGAIRGCFNELACTCDRSDVIDELKKIMFDSPSPDAIVDLRAAVRRELRMGDRAIDVDRQRAFVGRVRGALPGV